MSLNLNELKYISNNRPSSGRQRRAWNTDRILKIIQTDIRLVKKYGNKQKEKFFSEVGVLLSAGVDLQTILIMSVEGLKNKDKETSIYPSILASVRQGSNLADSMRNTGQFNNFDCFSVLIGENTGELAQVFDKLNKYYNKRIIQNRKITSTLSYPVIVLITTIGAIYFMLKFVVPMFSDTLLRFGGELPPLTQFIIALSNNITTYLLIVVGCISAGYLYYRRNKDTSSFQKRQSAMLLKIPYFGKLVYKSHLVQFTQAMDLLLNSKVNIVDCIDLTHKMVSFYPLKKALNHIKEDILRGEFFHASMEKQAFFETSLITLVRIGEEINQLDKIFVQLSKQYEEDLSYQSNILISILEPLMILILALLVAVILIAMYLPMFKIGTVIH